MWQLIVDVPGEGPSRKYFSERQKAEDYVKQTMAVGVSFALFTPQKRCVWSGVRGYNVVQKTLVEVE